MVNLQRMFHQRISTLLDLARKYFPLVNSCPVNSFIKLCYRQNSDFVMNLCAGRPIASLFIVKMRCSASI